MRRTQREGPKNMKYCWTPRTQLSTTELLIDAGRRPVLSSTVHLSDGRRTSVQLIRQLERGQDCLRIRKDERAPQRGLEARRVTNEGGRSSGTFSPILDPPSGLTLKLGATSPDPQTTSDLTKAVVWERVSRDSVSLFRLTCY